MTEGKTKASPVTAWQSKPGAISAVRWDGTAGVLAVLAEWGADPTPGPSDGIIRIWGSRGYATVWPGDYLVRDPEGATRYATEAFEAAYEPAPTPVAVLLARAQEAVALERERADAAEAQLTETRRQVDHLSAALAGESEGVRLWMLDCSRLVDKHRDHAAEVSLKLGWIRELAESWTADDGQGPPTKEMLLEAGCGRAVLNLINGGHPLNGAYPAAWSDAAAPGGVVCAVPDPAAPDGICGNPVESEPCGRHESPEEGGPS